MTDATPRQYQRFNLVQRGVHLMMLASFTTLAVTGLPQKYATTAWAETLIGLMGGIELVRIIHRIGAVVMISGSVVHVLEAGYRLAVLRQRPHMLPTLSDARDALDAFLYNLGLRDEHPRIGRFGFEEKAEYWAFVWGAIVMSITGFMMWNPITTTRFVPGEFIPAAKAAHGGEALLAVLAIILWHFYHVHIKHFNLSMWTGNLTEAEMSEYHPAELADIRAGRVDPLPDRQIARRRERVFVPVAGAVVVASAVGLYMFTTFEQTAITTVPPQDNVAFVPEEPTPYPTIPPTALPLAAGESGAGQATWVESIQPLFEERCGACHGTTAGLTLTEYDTALAGGNSGPAIVPGDAAGSLLVEKQAAGGHPGQLDDAELALVRQWIDAGAPQKSGQEAAEAAQPATADVTWTDIQPLLDEQCGTCHGTTAGLTLTEYDSALAGGNSGPAIVPGDAAGSLLVEKQAAGGHPGQLDEDQLELVRQWIDAGALEEAGEEAATGVKWTESIQPLFEERCGTCHGTTAGLTLTEYDSALAGGNSGPAIVPGDAAGSLLIEKQAAGGHPGQLDDDELELVRQWIDAGASSD